MFPVTESTLIPESVVTNCDGESGDAYVLIVTLVGPVSVVENSSVVDVLLFSLARVNFKLGML